LHSLQRQNKMVLSQQAIEDILDNSILLKTDDDIISAVESFNYTIVYIIYYIYIYISYTIYYTIQQAVWSVTPTSNPDINIEYSFAIKEKLAQKSFARCGKLTDTQS